MKMARTSFDFWSTLSPTESLAAVARVLRDASLSLATAGDCVSLKCGNVMTAKLTLVGLVRRT